MNKKQLHEMAEVQGWTIDSIYKYGGDVTIKLPNGTIFARLTKETCCDRAYTVKSLKYARFDCLKGGKYIEMMEAKELARLFPKEVSVSCIGASTTIIR